MTLKTLKPHTIEEHTKALADYMPGGDLFTAKNIQDKVMYDLLKGISRESVRAESYLVDLQEEFIPDKTNAFIADWERSLGIPDDCFKGTGTNDERRRDILVKLASLGVQTNQDFVDLAALFGITVTIRSGAELIVFPFTFPMFFFATEQDARFTIVVEFETSAIAATFPLVFPFTFGEEIIGTLTCLFNKLKPANCQVIFIGV